MVKQYKMFKKVAFFFSVVGTRKNIMATDNLWRKKLMATDN
jgi:hypothetical protein